MSDNPPVNRYLKNTAFDHIDHALGRPTWPLRESYRNYFATGMDGAQAQAFSASPYWALSGVQGNMAYYHVTDAGRTALAAHLASPGSEWRPYLVTYRGFERVVPAKSRSAARYRYFSALREVVPDLRFVDFAADARVRVAA